MKLNYLIPASILIASIIGVVSCAEEEETTPNDGCKTCSPYLYDKDGKLVSENPELSEKACGDTIAIYEAMPADTFPGDGKYTKWVCK